MKYEFIEADMLVEMFISGAKNLETHRDIVDRLNVFPVPDGDTGTNMSLTMNEAVKSIMQIKGATAAQIGKAVAKGSLMGARGNSGVILSQLLRGFSAAIEGKKSLDIFDFANAMSEAAQMAYRAVIKPIEGTILTVAREAGEYAIEIAKEGTGMLDFLRKVVDRANESLENTPNLLKALKDANVVDSGGKGLVLIYEGMYMALAGEPIRTGQDLNLDYFDDVHPKPDSQQMEYVYCTEFILKSQSITDEKIREYASGMGDSVVSASDGDIIKVHVHTNEPILVIQEALRHGELVKVKIENMRIQHESSMNLAGQVAKGRLAEEMKSYAIIAVASGDGISSIFKDMGADVVVEGGQTMNPSTSDFVESIKRANANNIIIFPNNKNIIMAANQAKEISTENVIVIPTCNIPQAFSAMVAFNPDMDPAENERSMLEAIKKIKTGQITFSVRDTNVNGKVIKANDIIGIVQGEIQICSGSVEDAAFETATKLIDNDVEMVSIFYGKDVTVGEAQALQSRLQQEHESVEFEVYDGGQPVYYYIISAE